MSAREVRLPALSATMEEATLLAWNVTVGETVRQGQPIAEVSTDKVDMDLEAPYDGTIVELLVEQGATVTLGQTLATIEAEEDDMFVGLDFAAETQAPSPLPEAAPSTYDPVPPTDTRGGIVAASPPARKMARQLGIDLTEVTPTGARGQVTPIDVKSHHERAGTPPLQTQQPAVESRPESPAPVSEAKRLAVRRATVDVMNRTALVPQFTLWRTLVLDRAAQRRGDMGWTTLLVRALAASLHEHPELNAHWDDEQRTAIPHDGHSVGLAVDRPGIGLVVATLPDPSLLDPGEAGRAVRGLVDRVRNGKIRPEDMAQASITLSNLGGLGVDRFNALLFPPQAAILSIGSIRHRPIATGDGALKAMLTAEVGLTVDHRVADGADGARYLETFSSYVESGG